MTYATLLADQKSLDRAVQRLLTKEAGDIPLGNLADHITEAYCTINRIPVPRLVSETDRNRFRRQVYAWYSSTYSAQSQQKGTKGTHRNVSMGRNRADYQFDKLYQEQLFKKYVFENERPEAVFLIHVAVAFKLSVYSLNELLSQYGYLPLHVKNVHHLAIYSVLSICDPRDGRYDQFELIKKRYFDAVELIASTQAQKPEHPMETLLLQEDLISLGKLNDDRYYAFIRKYAHELNGRHSAILAEHARLTNVFADLYEERRKGMYWEEEVQGYSLARFVQQYCKSISMKDFNEQLMGQINAKGRHPTRESMILLWLYAECHHGCQPIGCPAKYIDPPKMSAVCGGAQSAETVDGVAYKKYLFDIFSLLFARNGDCDEQQPVWNGRDVLVRMNAYLQKYDWGSLNKKVPFDRLIMMLLNGIVIERSLNHDQKVERETVKLNGETICTVCKSEVDESVPLPLALVFELLSRVRLGMGNARVEQAKTNKLKKQLDSFLQSVGDDASHAHWMKKSVWIEWTRCSRKLLSKGSFLCDDVAMLYTLTAHLLDDSELKSNQSVCSELVKIRGKLEDALPYPLQCALYELI